MSKKTPILFGQGGQAFAHPSRWEELLQVVRDRGGQIEPVVFRAVKNKCLNLFDKGVYNDSRDSLKFNGKFWNKRQLINHLKSLDEKDRNYSDILKDPQAATEIIEELQTRGCIRKLTPSEVQSEQVILNPINLLRIKNKTSLLLHFCLNDLYPKPTMSLVQLDKESYLLRRVDLGNSFDLKGSYYQYPLSDKSKLALSFTHRGEAFCCNTAVYGPSAIPFYRIIDLNSSR